ncbi:hypothetical protein PENTCL1PPCAC_29914, partial [Pristionchus entomophagus]
RLLTSSLLVALSSASFCGDSAIPFTLEILGDGQPVLGCARPTCFGWAPSGHPVSTTGAFYRINGKDDGYMRAGHESVLAYGPEDGRFYLPQSAVCEPTFSSANCAGPNKWVGGIAPLLNVTSFQTMLQCCAYDGLLQSEDRGVASLHAGQAVVGGEVISSGLQVGFDYISDISKVLRVDGTVQYDVAVRRMPCASLADPAASAKIPMAEGAAAQAFQAPNLPVDQPLPLPPTPTDNQILEEIVQEEAFQLPAGTQFQPPPPPPPSAPLAFQPPPVQFVPAQAAAVPYNPPVAFYGGGGGGTAQWCYSADSTVELLDGSIKRMDELKKTDWVLTVGKKELQYEPVEFWLHRVPDQEAVFNNFETEDGRTIKLTDKHYIYKGDCSRVSAGHINVTELPKEAVFADQVHAGDCLYTADNERKMHEVRVVSASKVTQTGIFAPMTTNGKIVVNGVYASCHNIMQAHSMGHSFFDFLGKMSDIYDSLFGYETEGVIETPAGLSTYLAMAELIIPKNLVTM